MTSCAEREAAASTLAGLAIQLLHPGVRGSPTYEPDPRYDLDSTLYALAPGQVPLSGFPGGHTSGEASGKEAEAVLDCHASGLARRLFADPNWAVRIGCLQRWAGAVFPTRIGPRSVRWDGVMADQAALSGEAVLLDDRGNLIGPLSPCTRHDGVRGTSLWP
jgi:hypothetical protein